jgi:Ca2+-binding EF-hand superfamily protein
MSFKSLIAFVAVAAWTGPALAAALAAEGKAVGRAAQAADLQRADRRFDELDRNRDGSLSRDEAAEARELDTRFSELDANNDGKLSRDEYRVVTAGERQTLPGAASAASGATRPR